MELMGFSAETWLPFVFIVLMGVSMLAYVVLDGFDLGVGMLTAVAASEDDRDRMVASIGPFWDANETWLVLGVGILLVAFPAAHGVILTALYLPVALMLLGLILRGVAFEFRAKVAPNRKRIWNIAFFVGSLITALAQGYMLGLFIMGLESTWATNAFGALTAVCVAAAYVFVGATWLIIKAEGELQRDAVRWANWSIWAGGAGLAAVSIATPLVSERIFEKWFTWPNIAMLAPIPILTGILCLILLRMLSQMPYPKDRWNWVPFVITIAVFVLGFLGLAYSFFPYIVPDKLTIWETASAPESLIIILVGALFVLPVIIAYSALSYYVFRGKATALKYE
ncbi:MAG: cytochrome d ubiquinol oxidase subunit II [Pseudomonadota bacterium]